MLTEKGGQGVPSEGGNYQVVGDDDFRLDDGILTSLLHRVYVDGGYTDERIAEGAFEARAVRARGPLFWARDENGEALGVVTLVPPGANAARVATQSEAELHLLAVSPEHRRKGVGEALVRRVVQEALLSGCSGVALYTQPTMGSAHRLYAAAGFVPVPERNFLRHEVAYRVLRLSF